MGQTQGEKDCAFTNLTSIDNWYEFLGNAGIVRECGSWVARLALADTPLVKSQNLVVASKEICRVCVQDVIQRSGKLGVLETTCLLLEAALGSCSHP